MMNRFVDMFKQLEQDLANIQHRIPVTSCLKVYYGITTDKKYRLSFISTIRPYEFESSKEIKITQGQESENVFWTCFDLNNEEAKDVFFIFCDSLIQSIENQSDEFTAMSSLQNRYYSWRLLLKNKGKMSYESYQGLFGELYFLSELLSKDFTIDEAIESWVGPDGYSKDFSVKDSWFEVKTVGTSSTSIKINSLNQLDSDIKGHMVVIVVEKMSDQFEAGLCSVPIIYRNILNKITNHQVREDFINKVLKYGFIDDDETINNYKYEVKKVVYYCIDNDFPKLTKDNIKSNAISQVTYDLLISAIEKYKEEIL